MQPHIAQFHLEGYATPYRLDRNANGGGILLYIREHIPSKLLNTDLSIEGFFVEIRNGSFAALITLRKT